MTFLRNNWTYEQGSSPALFREGRGFRDGTAPSLTLRDSPSGLGLSRPFLQLRSTRSSCPQAWLLQSRCSSSSPLAAPAHEVLALIWGPCSEFPPHEEERGSPLWPCCFSLVSSVLAGRHGRAPIPQVQVVNDQCQSACVLS